MLAKRLKNLVTIYGVTAGMHMILQFDQSLPVAKILRCIREAGLPMVLAEADPLLSLSNVPPRAVQIFFDIARAWIGLIVFGNGELEHVFR